MTVGDVVILSTFSDQSLTRDIFSHDISGAIDSPAGSRETDLGRVLCAGGRAEQRADGGGEYETLDSIHEADSTPRECGENGVLSA